MTGHDGPEYPAIGPLHTGNGRYPQHQAVNKLYSRRHQSRPQHLRGQPLSEIKRETDLAWIHPVGPLSHMGRNAPTTIAMRTTPSASASGTSAGPGNPARPRKAAGQGHIVVRYGTN